MSSWAVSTIELCEGAANAKNGAEASSHRGLLRLAWQTFSSKIQQLGGFLRRETNKPLPKELRRSLRLNKSAKRKGYQFYESAADKKRKEEYLNQPININIRVGPAYEYRPSNC
ncbi:uncharacterized protein LOC133836485 [Drosophila sulfurigaster albostrigata]|uniref:uncharacterized protein LOC133836485 n=1 Tax=Drosophila sulfurigaster albostrigata TaxID=89887 RepID=UPI002D21E4FC|nr:uncharacterized protein LOC133836485 [Drosophila sulfurigaster albostrigata]